MKTTLLCLAGVLLAAPALAQALLQPDDPNATPSVQMTVSPAPEPRPALKYLLLPAPHERTPGNAATSYYRALLHLAALPEGVRKEYGEKETQWIEGPIDEFPKEEVRKWLDANRHVLAEIRNAAYREHCRFDLQLGELRGMEIISFLLHEFQEMRQLARILRLKARLEIAEGRLDDAYETLRMGYQLGRDAAEPPLLINGLIGIAITSIMNEQLRELIDAPGSPNMYWALAAMPKPLIDLRAAMEFEMNMPLQMYPFLKDAETAKRTPDEWQALISQAVVELLEMNEQQSTSGPQNSWPAQLAATAMIAKAYPVAKEELIAAGFAPERVEKMPVGQVIAIQAARAYRHAYHELFKWTLLPYAEGRPLMSQVEDQLKREGYLGQGFSGQDALPLARLLLPAIQAVQSAVGRSHRDVAALMNLEAIRLHAAETGKLPGSLGEIKIVPVPKNPVTGEPFAYQREGDEAKLDVPLMRNPQDGRRLIIRLEKKKGATN